MAIPFTPQEMLAIVVGASFAAGLNVYATVAVLGLLARAELFSLPASLHVVEAWPTIAAAIALFIIEFVADKIPGFDLIWNALQTFVREDALAIGLVWFATRHPYAAAVIVVILLVCLIFVVRKIS